MRATLPKDAEKWKLWPVPPPMALLRHIVIHLGPSWESRASFPIPYIHISLPRSTRRMRALPQSAPGSPKRHCKIV